MRPIQMLAAMAAAAVVSGCGVVASGSVPRTPGASVPAAATRSAPPLPVLTMTTPPPRTPAPALRTTGTAWPAILASLSGYGQWLLANPNPALVGTIATPGCGMANLLSRQLQGLLADRANAVPKRPVFGPVTGPSTGASPLGNQVVLDVIASRRAEPVIGRSGTVLGQIDALPATALEVTLNRGGDGRWRFCTVNAVADTGDPEDPSVALL